MDHGEALTAISERLCRPLDPAASDALAEHLVACEPCRVEAVAWERTWAMLGADDASKDDSGLSATAAARILPRLRAATLARPANVRRQRRQRLYRAAAAGGLALAAAAVLLLVIPKKRGPFQPTPAEVEVQLAAAPAPAPQASEVPLPEAAANRMAALVSDVRTTDGRRAQAIALADASLDRANPPEAIVDALARTLRSDRNPGVRLRAAEALARLAPTSQIREAFIRALERDGNPAVRIVAVEALGRAARDFDPDSIEALRERASDESESTHVRTRSARALETIKL